MGESHDVLIMGGGPAGTACGNFLAREGLDVVVLEGDRHPRHHIGESLLAASMPVLETLGVSMGEMAERFQQKYGARFYDPVTDRLETFEFAAVPGSVSPSYQVLREQFDAMLAQKARDAGCAVWENAMIDSFDEHAERPTVQLRDGASSPAGFLSTRRDANRLSRSNTKPER